MGILKLISLFYAIWFTTINIMKFIRGEKIPSGNMFMMALGLTIFIALQFNLI